MDPVNTPPADDPPPGRDPHDRPDGCGQTECVRCWQKHAIDAGDCARYWLGEHTAKLADDVQQLPHKDRNDPTYRALDKALWVLQTCLQLWARQDPRPPFYAPDPTRLYPWKAMHR